MARAKTLARKEKAEVEPYESWDTFKAMERMFSDFLTSPFTLLRTRSLLIPEIRSDLVPEVDMRETKKELIHAATVPGLEKDDFEINATSNHITMSGERKCEDEKPGETYYVRQQSYRLFNASYDLPMEIKPRAVNAIYKNGVLSVHMPKAKVAEKLNVKAEVKD